MTRFLLFVCALSIVAGLLPQGVWATDEQPETRSPHIQRLDTCPTIAKERFFHSCENLLARGAVPVCLKEYALKYMSDLDYRQDIHTCLPHRDALRHDLEIEVRYSNVFDSMLKTLRDRLRLTPIVDKPHKGQVSYDPGRNKIFVNVMTCLGIIHNGTEPLSLRLRLACRLQEIDEEKQLDTNKTMTDLLEEVFETKYNPQSLNRLNNVPQGFEYILAEFLEGARTLPANHETRTKVIISIFEMQGRSPDHRLQTLLYLAPGEERDSLLLPLLTSETVKLDPESRRKGILGLQNIAEKVALLQAFASNASIHIERRLDALRLLGLQKEEEGEASLHLIASSSCMSIKKRLEEIRKVIVPGKVKREFLQKCLEEQIEDISGFKPKIEKLLASLSKVSGPMILAEGVAFIRAAVGDEDIILSRDQVQEIEMEVEEQTDAPINYATMEIVLKVQALPARPGEFRKAKNVEIIGINESI